jgi:hypothetical protein
MKLMFQVSKNITYFLLFKTREHFLQFEKVSLHQTDPLEGI